MGQLLSPGVQVNIIDESFYTPSGPGTIPCIFIATGDNKPHPSGDGIAEGTLPENAGELYLMTSQRELIQTFGEPFFEQVQGTPVHGSELNEYGLWAAWSFMGLANRAYIIRASLNTSQLFPSVTEPRGEPLSGTYWLDTGETSWGAFVSNGGPVPGLAWEARNEFVIDTRVETDMIILGTVGYVNPALPAINTPGGDLIINDTTVTLNPGDSLDDVVAAINAASIDNIVAEGYRIMGQSHLLIRDTSASVIDIDNTSAPTVLADLGISAPADQILTPKKSIGFDGDIAVVTLTGATGISDLVYFQKLTPQQPNGTPDPNSSTFWFPIGEQSWKAATPTVVNGTSTPTEVSIGDQLVLSDGVNSVTVTFTTSTSITAPGTKATVADVVTDINAAITALPPAAQPELIVQNAGGAILISNPTGEDVILSEPPTNTDPVLSFLGIVSRNGNRLFYSPHTTYPANSQSGDVWIRTTQPNGGVNYVVKIYSAFTGQFNTLSAPFYESDDAATDALGVNAASGNLYVQYNLFGTPTDPIASHLIKSYNGFSRMEVLGDVQDPTITAGQQFTITAGQPNAAPVTTTITVLGTEADDVAQAITNAAIPNVQATTQTGRVRVINVSGYSLTFENVGTDTVLDDIGIQETTYSNWSILNYEASVQEPTTEAPEGTLWYNTNFRADIMVGDGDEWKGYRIVYPNTDPFGPIIAGSPPVTQTDGTPLVDNDLWIDASDLENYPRIYRYQVITREWVLIDNTDQTTPFGIVFRDARYTADGKEDGSQDPRDMVLSNFLDPDAPDPRTYPSGMLLFNTRYSFGNVKEWRPNYFEEFIGVTSDTFPGAQYNVGFATFPINTIDENNMARWVTVSGNRTDGAPFMLRKAQRQMVVRSLGAAIVNNEDARSETVFFNLIAAPGYPELIDELVVLNQDKKEIAFIIGDTPLRLSPNSGAIDSWAKNEAMAASTGEEGLTIANTYVGLYYPWGLGTNIDGAEVVIPPSAVMLRVMVFNDQIAYPWFAPAGFTRGAVTNASSFGWLEPTEGEFRVVFLNQGQRDTLYLNNINPIAFIPNRGWVVFGQKTLHPVASALDRVNVVRLINYLRYQFDIIAKPFLFEPNDDITRDAAQAVFENLLANVQGLRGIGDFVVIVDESNNTPERIDRNELWIDVALEPIRAIEFIYIPVRIVNTGTL